MIIRRAEARRVRPTHERQQVRMVANNPLNSAFWMTLPPRLRRTLDAFLRGGIAERVTRGQAARPYSICPSVPDGLSSRSLVRLVRASPECTADALVAIVTALGQHRDRLAARLEEIELEIEGLAARARYKRGYRPPRLVEAGLVRPPVNNARARPNRETFMNRVSNGELFGRDHAPLLTPVRFRFYAWRTSRSCFPRRRSHPRQLAALAAYRCHRRSPERTSVGTFPFSPWRRPASRPAPQRTPGRALAAGQGWLGAFSSSGASRSRPRRGIRRT
jgi:hypothetical protein